MRKKNFDIPLFYPYLTGKMLRAAGNPSLELLIEHFIVFVRVYQLAL